jgi:hypothetical protein
MVDKDITMNNVVNAITEQFDSFLHVIGSDSNAEELVLRIR